MKKYKYIKIIIFIAVIAIIAIIFHSIIKFKIKSSDIANVTVQYRYDTITINNLDEINKFCNKFETTNFYISNCDWGSKGWTYWIKCYNSKDKLIYNFKILNNSTIICNHFYYKTKENNFDKNYLKKLFEQNKND